VKRRLRSVLLTDPEPPKRSHFLHIGKTGGSALRGALREVAREATYPAVYHGHHVALWDVSDGERVFFVIRDPVERFVSGFWSRYRKGRPHTDVEWSDDEAIAFERFPTPQALAEALLRDGDDLDFAAAVEAMQSIQHVRNHLSAWLGSPGYLRRRESDIVWIGTQQTLSADLPSLARAIGASAITMPSDDVAAHRTPRDLDTNLTPPAAHAIQLWFASDYDLIKECERIRTRLAAAGQ
jgi:hypothetical protein